MLVQRAVPEDGPPLPCSAPPCSAGPQCGYPSTDADNTLIILDWDDTVLPTSYLASLGHRVDGPGPAGELAAELESYAVHVEGVLRILLSLGLVVICTNAETGWVDLTCAKFLPRLVGLVGTIEQMSARSEFEPRGVWSPYEWKKHAFAWILSSKGRLNVLSLGDSCHERAAVIHACQGLDDARVCCKSLKFLDRPDLHGLVLQHQKALAALPQCLQHCGHLDLFMAPQSTGPSSPPDLVIAANAVGPVPAAVQPM